jgi:hypothetical protein
MVIDNSDSPPKVRLAKGQEVSLGCGTLILIALIVIFFGNANRSEKTNLSPVLQKLDAIEKQLDRLEKRLGEPKVQPKDK